MGELSFSSCDPDNFPGGTTVAARSIHNLLIAKYSESARVPAGVPRNRPRRRKLQESGKTRAPPALPLGLCRRLRCRQLYLSSITLDLRFNLDSVQQYSQELSVLEFEWAENKCPAGYLSGPERQNQIMIS